MVTIKNKYNEQGNPKAQHRAGNHAALLGKPLEQGRQKD
jgi:hypothetical protein